MYSAVNTSSGERQQIFLVYWWPGREYKKLEELPYEFHKMIRHASELESNYLVFSCVDIPDYGRVYGISQCMKIDKPRRKYGRDRALGLLRQELLRVGYEVVKV